MARAGRPPKTEGSNRVHLIIDPDVKRELADLAKEVGISMSSAVEVILRNHLTEKSAIDNLRRVLLVERHTLWEQKLEASRQALAREKEKPLPHASKC